MRFPFSPLDTLNQLAECAKDKLALRFRLKAFTCSSQTVLKKSKKGVRKKVHACCMNKNCDSLTQHSQPRGSNGEKMCSVTPTPTPTPTPTATPPSFPLLSLPLLPPPPHTPHTHSSGSGLSRWWSTSHHLMQWSQHLRQWWSTSYNSGSDCSTCATGGGQRTSSSSAAPTTVKVHIVPSPAMPA